MSLLAVMLGALYLVQAPAEWDALRARATELRDQRKFAEAIALLEPHVNKWPAFSGVHEELGRMHRELAKEAQMEGAAGAAARRRHLESAVTHYRRVLELDPDPPPIVPIELADMHDPFGLNKPVEWEFYSRRLVEKKPGTLLFRTRLADLLAQTGREAEAARVLHEARAVTPDQYPKSARGMLAMHMTTFVSQATTLPVADVKLLLDDALALGKEEMTRDPKDADMLLLRAKALQLMSERVETDSARKATLMREANAALAAYEKMQPR
jgi:tetratricopeptide (TPR) repeat protein